MSPRSGEKSGMRDRNVRANITDHWAVRVRGGPADHVSAHSPTHQCRQGDVSVSLSLHDEYGNEEFLCKQHAAMRLTGNPNLLARAVIEIALTRQ
jgi:hypothetical protein